MSEKISQPNLTCWDCGVTNHPDASECWLCQRRDWRRYPGPWPGRIQPRSRDPLSSIAGWMVLIALVAVVAGMVRLAPGLGIALLISMLLAWVITAVKASRRRRRDQPMSGLEKILWIVGLTVLIPVLLLVALLIALFLFCAFFAR